MEEFDGWIEEEFDEFEKGEAEAGMNSLGGLERRTENKKEDKEEEVIELEDLIETDEKTNLVHVKDIRFESRYSNEMSANAIYEIVSKFGVISYFRFFHAGQIYDGIGDKERKEREEGPYDETFLKYKKKPFRAIVRFEFSSQATLFMTQLSSPDKYPEFVTDCGVKSLKIRYCECVKPEHRARDIQVNRFYMGNLVDEHTLCYTRMYPGTMFEHNPMKIYVGRDGDRFFFLLDLRAKEMPYYRVVFMLNQIEGLDITHDPKEGFAYLTITMRRAPCIHKLGYRRGSGFTTATMMKQEEWKVATDMSVRGKHLEYGVEYVHKWIVRENDKRKHEMYGLNEDRSRKKKPNKMRFGYCKQFCFRFLYKDLITLYNMTEKMERLYNSRFRMYDIRRKEFFRDHRDEDDLLQFKRIMDLHTREDLKFINEWMEKKSKEEFENLYLLEVCISSRTIPRECLSRKFLELLDELPKDQRHVFLRRLSYSKHETHFRPIELLKEFQERVNDVDREDLKGRIRLTNKEDLDFQQSIVITPARVIILPPKIDRKNRVIRQFGHHRNHFLRVQFSSELTNAFPRRNREYEDLVRHYVEDGVYVCGRLFKGLCFSASQLRTGSFWFASEIKIGGEVKSTDLIREWMGDFTSESDNIAKIATRMGLCFSGSVGTKDFFEIQDHNYKEIPDIERNGYIYSDGVGRVNNVLLRRIIQVLRLPKETSAVQIRFKGCKGMLTRYDVDEAAPIEEKQILIQFRPSQRKFTTKENHLDICKYSKFQPMFMNRDLIIGLECRDFVVQLLKHLRKKFSRNENGGGANTSYEKLEGWFKTIKSGRIPPELLYSIDQTELLKFKEKGKVYQNITKKLKEYMKKLDDMMEDVDACKWVLKNIVCRSPLARQIMEAINCGFSLQEPMIRKTLFSWSRTLKRRVQRKMRIFVEKGGYFFGVIDEYNVLKYNEVFLTVLKKDERLELDMEETLSGPIFVSKNPSIHPGDFRTFTAIDVPNLSTASERCKEWYRNLNNVIVFSALGERSNPNELSGSDLDGDEYSVVWDHDLIPTSNNFEPADYGGGPASLSGQKKKPVPMASFKKHFRERMTMKDICSFYLRFQSVYNLGQLSNLLYSHYAKSPFVLLCDECRELAVLHSKCVDSPKTNERVVIPDHLLRLREQPNFILLEADREVYRTRLMKTGCLISKLYSIMLEEMEKVSEIRLLEGDVYKNMTPDPDLVLDSLPRWSLYVREAEILRDMYYDELEGIMNMYNILNEEDVFTGGYLYYNKRATISLQSLHLAVKNLNSQFWSYFDRTTRRRYLDRMVKASAWYYVNYKNGKPKFLSFSWTVQSVLGEIKSGLAARKLDMEKEGENMNEGIGVDSDDDFQEYRSKKYDGKDDDDYQFYRKKRGNNNNNNNNDSAEVEGSGEMEFYKYNKVKKGEHKRSVWIREYADKLAKKKEEDLRERIETRQKEDMEATYAMEKLEAVGKNKLSRRERRKRKEYEKSLSLMEKKDREEKKRKEDEDRKRRKVERKIKEHRRRQRRVWWDDNEDDELKDSDEEEEAVLEDMTESEEEEEKKLVEEESGEEEEEEEEGESEELGEISITDESDGDWMDNIFEKKKDSSSSEEEEVEEDVVVEDVKKEIPRRKEKVIVSSNETKNEKKNEKKKSEEEDEEDEIVSDDDDWGGLF